MRRRLTVLSLVTAASAALSACELRLGVDVALGHDGSGTLELIVGLDEELDEALAQAGADPLRGLDDLRAAAPEWELETVEPDAGGRELHMSTSFDEPGDLEQLVGELRSALDPEDGEFLGELAVTVRDDRHVALTGRAGFVPPEVPGATGLGVAFDEDDLARLIEERGAELIVYDLRVTFPAPPDEGHGADEVDGRTLVWHLPIGDTREIAASSPPASDRRTLILAGVAVATAVVSATVVAVTRRRRRDVSYVRAMR